MKNIRTLYTHPDGAQIQFDQAARELTVIDSDGTCVWIGIGPAGLIEFAETLRLVGEKWAEELRQQGLI